MNSSETWFSKVAGKRSEGEVARDIGLVQSTLSRQLRADALSPEHVVTIAREYGASPVQALVDLGLISMQEVRDLIGVATVQVVSDEVLVDEVLERIRRGGHHPALTDPVLDIEPGSGQSLTAE